jgi:hypothetical protein
MKRVCQFLGVAVLFSFAIGYSMPSVTSVPQPNPDPWQRGERAGSQIQIPGTR